MSAFEIILLEIYKSKIDALKLKYQHNPYFLDDYLEKLAQIKDELFQDTLKLTPLGRALTEEK